MLDQDNNSYLIHLSILINSLLDSGWILWGEVWCESLLGAKGLIKNTTSKCKTYLDQHYYSFFFISVITLLRSPTKSLWSAVYDVFVLWNLKYLHRKEWSYSQLKSLIPFWWKTKWRLLFFRILKAVMKQINSLLRGAREGTKSPPFPEFISPLSPSTFRQTNKTIQLWPSPPTPPPSPY